MKLAIAAILVLGSLQAANDDELQYLRIDSTPSGARVVINGRDKGPTPFEMKLGRWAFEIKKTSLFSKRLSEPMTLEVSMEGYRTETLQITRGPLVWRSLNGKNAYSFWVINSPHYDVRLRPATRTLTNADVIQLVKTGIAETLVIDKIQTSSCEFRTDPEDLSALHAAGLSDAIISAMMHALPLDQAGPATNIEPRASKK